MTSKLVSLGYRNHDAMKRTYPPQNQGKLCNSDIQKRKEILNEKGEISFNQNLNRGSKCKREQCKLRKAMFQKELASGRSDIMQMVNSTKAAFYTTICSSHDIKALG